MSHCVIEHNHVQQSDRAAGTGRPSGKAAAGPASLPRAVSPADAGAPKPHVILFVAVDWYFCLHWLPLACALRDAGYAVTVLTEVTDEAMRARIHAAGLGLVPLRLSRRGINLLAELRTLRSVVRALRAQRPDVLHAIAQKPVLYGAIAARFARTHALVATFAGMGYLFTSRSLSARLLRPLVVFAYRQLLVRRQAQVIVQNPDDGEQLQRQAGIRPVLIRGAGVDLNRFEPRPAAPGPLTVILASRLLWDKGVGEFVEAAAILAQQGVSARMALVGKPDTGNPSAVPEALLHEWQARGPVEWWGHHTDMPRVLSKTHVVCLPSYREGLPTILLEAAAAGLPLVASDVPGCREIVHHGHNGLLVPARDVPALVSALVVLIRSSSLRERFGRESRRLAEREFGIDRVTEETLSVYQQLRMAST